MEQPTRTPEQVAFARIARILEKLSAEKQEKILAAFDALLGRVPK